jgi:hypothetical protein
MTKKLPKQHEDQLFDLHRQVREIEMNMRVLAHEFEHLLIRIAKLEGLK